MRLQDRVAIVTGGGRGIGRATALALAAEGCHVVLAARTESEIAAVAREVEARGRRALPVVCDVAVEADVRRLVDRARETFGAVHILINNAGGVNRLPLIETTVEEWDGVLSSQVRGTFLVTRFALPLLLEAGWGRIVTIGSLAGRTGVRERVAYCTAKWGQIGFTAALAEELHGTPVRAHIVCPGPTATRMRFEGFPDEVPESMIQPEDVADQIICLLTLPETAYVREVDVRPGLEIQHRER
jgi:NAD(P)-dependent dehydrogenase (short-subunit alcohol dehydrogenase family)